MTIPYHRKQMGVNDWGDQSSRTIPILSVWQGNTPPPSGNQGKFLSRVITNLNSRYDFSCMIFHKGIRAGSGVEKNSSPRVLWRITTCHYNKDPDPNQSGWLMLHVGSFDCYSIWRHFCWRRKRFFLDILPKKVYPWRIQGRIYVYVPTCKRDSYRPPPILHLLDHVRSIAEVSKNPKTAICVFESYFCAMGFSIGD